MVLWILLPVLLSLTSCIGTWTVYGLSLSNGHVCSLGDWGVDKFCIQNQSIGCCLVPSISGSGSRLPESCLFTATVNMGAFLFLLFCVFHHAHIMEKHACQSRTSKCAVVFGVAAAMGAFVAGNCNPHYLPFLHFLGAGISFFCICFYTVLLTSLTGRCVLTGYERFLYLLRITSTVLQAVATICYAGLYPQNQRLYGHLSAVFEWALSVNLELFELSYAVEFYFFSSFMISNLLHKRDEEKHLILTMS